MKKGNIWNRILVMMFSMIMIMANTSPLLSFASEDTCRTVKIGYTYSTGYYLDNDGALGGYGHDYDQILTQYTGWNIEYVEGSWEDLNKMLADGKIDLLGFLIETKDRQAKYSFADMPSGSAMCCLVTRNDDARFSFEDFDNFYGMNVGYHEGNRNLDEFDEWSIAHGFHVNKKRYLSNDDILEALDEEEIDAAFVTDFCELNDYNVIAKFAPQNFYYATTKGNRELLAELNEAQRDIDIFYPNLKSLLYETYFSYKNGHKANFTQEELDYLATNPEVTVIPCGADKPFEVYNEKTGQYEGFIPKVLQQIGAVTGIEFHYIHSNDRWGISDHTIEGNKISAFSHDFDWSRDNNVCLTEPFAESDVSIVKRNSKVEIKTVALTKNEYINNMVSIIHPEWLIQQFQSVEDCLKALQSGSCDAVLMNSHEADYFLSIGRYSVLHQQLSDDISQDISFAVSKDSDPMLLRVLSKSILMISEEDYYNMLDENVNEKKNTGLIDLIYTNPLQFIGILALISILLLIVGIQLIQSRRAYRLIDKISNEDKITQLYNRNAYENRIREHQRTIFSKIGCVYMDANGLHELNNTKGHAAGDRMLKSVAEYLRRYFPKGNIYRIGGDEFVILMDNTDESEIAERMAKVIQEIEADGYTISYGIEIRKDEMGLEDLIIAADKKMLQNKKEFYEMQDKRTARI